MRWQVQKARRKSSQTFVSERVYAGVCLPHLGACAWGGQESTLGIIFQEAWFLIQGQSLVWTFPVRLCWLTGQWGLGLQTCITMAGSLCGFWKTDLGFYACEASSLSTEWLHWALLRFFYLKIWFFSRWMYLSWFKHCACVHIWKYYMGLLSYVQLECFYVSVKNESKELIDEKG